MSEQEQQPVVEEREQDIGEDINVKTILTVGVVTALVIVVVVIALVGLFNQSQQREIEIKAAAAPAGELDQLKRDQLARLGSYEWVDRERGIVSIPIAQAMQVAVAKLAEAQSAPPPVSADQAGEETGAANSGEDNHEPAMHE
ncbi:hypothetical protein JW859_06105 [bacterium]|nr:hypothetical protein [bacterium]